MPRQVAQKIGAIPTPSTFDWTENKNRRPRAHNSKYTPQIARKICERIMLGETLLKICEDPRMPSQRNLVGWLADPHNAEFREMYYYARRVQCEFLIDEVIDIADNTDNDWIPTYNRKGEQNGWKPDNEAIQRSRVRIDTRKWLAAKLIPRIYGEKIDHHHELTGDLAELLKAASNQDSGLPPPIEGKKRVG